MPFQYSVMTDISHVRQFGGDIWHVANDGSNANPGTAEAPFEDILYAIAVAAAGDAISVKAGTYDEAGLDLNLDGLELWCEIGAVLSNSTPGTVLTVSGDYCRVVGARFIQAGQTGLHVTGGRCEIEDCQAGPGLATGFDIDGARTRLCGCHTVAYTVDGYYIGNDCCSLRDCSAIGTGTATRGFYVTGSADRVRLWNCASVANATAGYEIDTGCVNTLVKDCASGGGDGARVDDGTNTVWSHYTFDSLLHKVSTLAGADDYDLYQITGIVQINYLYGYVETQIAAGTTGAYLNLFPTGGAAIEITDITGAGRDISGAVMGSLMAKTGLATVALDLDSAALGFVAEVATNYRNVLKPFVVGQKTGGIDTFIRFTVAGVGASGVIHWHCDWEPISDDGFVVAV